MAEARRTQDIGRIVGVDPTDDAVVYAYFDAVDSPDFEPFAVPVPRAEIEDAGYDVCVDGGFWADVVESARTPQEVQPRVIPESKLLGEYTHVSTN